MLHVFPILSGSTMNASYFFKLAFMNFARPKFSNELKGEPKTIHLAYSEFIGNKA